MQTFIISILFLSIAIFAKAQSTSSSEPTYSIIVTVENARSDEGKMMFSLNTESQFMRSKPFKSDSVLIKGGVATVTFNNIPAGDYAILVLHDKNDNGIMDYESNGMPKEAYGMSNNPMSYGPPVFEEARITVTENSNLKIVI